MIIFATSTLVQNENHWMTWVAFLGATILFLFVCAIILLLSLSNLQKLTNGPFYLRRAPDILKWVAFVAPTLVLFSCLISLYDSLIEMSLRGDFTIDAWAGPIGEFVFLTIIGLGVSLFCLIGIAIHFFRTRNS